MSDCKTGQRVPSPFIDECILDCVDDALGIRNDLGLYKACVSIVTREWSGEHVGRGTHSDTEEAMRPMPDIREYSHDLRVKEGGTIQGGDILLRGVSMKSYTEDQMNLKVEKPYIEKFFKIGGSLYESISVTKKYATMDVLIRKISEKADYSKDAEQPSNGEADVIV